MRGGECEGNMNEHEVAARLVADVEANLAWIQISAIAVGGILLIVSSFLFVRAYSALAEARILYARYSPAADGSAKRDQAQRQATPDNINKAGSPGKPALRHRRRLP